MFVCSNVQKARERVYGEPDKSATTREKDGG